MAKNPQISIVIPAYNCQKYVAGVIKRTVKVLNSLNQNFEVILVNDGSLDNTQEFAENEARRHGGKVRVLGYEKNKGKGFAVKYGMKEAKGSTVGFIDCDEEIYPESLVTLYKKLISENCDVVVGSKRHKDSVITYPLIRRAVSLSYFLLVKLLFGFPVSDTQAGVKLFKDKVIKKILPKLKINGFAFDVEMLYWVRKYGYKKICEAPITVRLVSVSEASVIKSFGLVRESLKMFLDTVKFFVSTIIR